MIITRTPFRISFFGGGSDMEEFYQHHPGAVLSVAINKYMYLSSHPLFDEGQIRVQYSQSETVSAPGELRHPIAREVLQRFGVKGGLEISSHANIPAGTGMGSSSAYTVGLLHNLYIRSGKYVTKYQLAEEACDVEINKLKEPIGKQDQYAAAFGGMNVIRFESNGRVVVEPIHLKRDYWTRLEDSLLLFYTGKQRAAGSVLAQQKKNLLSGEKIGVLKKMVELVEKGRLALYDGDIATFGALLDKAWTLKRGLASAISNSDIDEAYKRGRENGALGGKLLGAGGGGFLLMVAEPKNHERLRAAMSPLRAVSFRFEHDGSIPIYIGDELETGLEAGFAAVKVAKVA